MIIVTSPQRTSHRSDRQKLSAYQNCHSRQRMSFSSTLLDKEIHLHEPPTPWSTARRKHLLPQSRIRIRNGLRDQTSRLNGNKFLPSTTGVGTIQHISPKSQIEYRITRKHCESTGYKPQYLNKHMFFVLTITICCNKTPPILNQPTNDLTGNVSSGSYNEKPINLPQAIIELISYYL